MGGRISNLIEGLQFVQGSKFDLVNLTDYSFCRALRAAKMLKIDDIQVFDDPAGDETVEHHVF